MKKIIIIITQVLLLANNYAVGATNTSNLLVNTKLTSTCTLSATNANFGVLGTDANVLAETTGNIAVLCSKNTPYSIALTQSSPGVRTMVGKEPNNNDGILYQICQIDGYPTTCGLDAAQYTWSYTSGTIKQGTGTGALQTYPMYVYAKQGYFTPDSYSATETAVITY